MRAELTGLSLLAAMFLAFLLPTNVQAQRADSEDEPLMEAGLDEPEPTPVFDVYTWVKLPVINLAYQVGSCASQIIAVSNVDFTRGPIRYPAFAYIIDKNSCTNAPNELRLAIYNGTSWKHWLLDTPAEGPCPNCYHAMDQVLELCDALVTLNMSIAFEDNGSVGIAIEGSDAQSLDQVLYLNFTPINGWGSTVMTSAVAIPNNGQPSSQPDFRAKQLYIAPGGEPWIVAGYAHPDPQTTQLSFATRQNGVWISGVGSGITGYDDAFVGPSLPPNGDGMLSYDLGLFYTDPSDGHSYPVASLYSAHATKQLHASLPVQPGLSVGDLNVIDTNDLDVCSGTLPFGMHMSLSGQRVWGQIRAYSNGPSCVQQYELRDTTGTLIPNALPYKGLPHQIVDDSVAGQVAYLYSDLESANCSSGMLKVRFRGESDILHTLNASYSNPLRNALISKGPSTAQTKFKNVPCVIVYYREPNYSGPIAYQYDRVEVWVPVASGIGTAVLTP